MNDLNYISIMIKTLINFSKNEIIQFYKLELQLLMNMIILFKNFFIYLYLYI